MHPSITVPPLIVRSGNDFWSRPEDPSRIAAHLVHESAQVVAIRDATHFVHLDKAERGRQLLLSTVLTFVSSLRSQRP